jgi:hypothetical protein
MKMEQEEIGEFELTVEELDSASGGLKNNETEAWAVFCTGVIAGRIMGGATLRCD